MEKEIVIYRYRDMIYSASQNMIYAGGEFSFDKISRFCYPASSSGAEYSLQYFSVHVTAPHQAAYGVLVKVLL